MAAESRHGNRRNASNLRERRVDGRWLLAVCALRHHLTVSSKQPRQPCHKLQHANKKVQATSPYAYALNGGNNAEPPTQRVLPQDEEAQLAPMRASHIEMQAQRCLH